MSDNSRTARAFLSALEARDTRPIEHLLTEDAVEVLPLAASGSIEPAAVFDGRDAVMSVQDTIVAAFTVIGFAEVRMTESADATTVFVESVGRRVQKDTGRVYENVYLMRFDFRDGLIEKITEYSNPVAFAKFFDRPLG